MCQYSSLKTVCLAVICFWFTVGGISHFVAPDLFLKIIPPSLPLRLEAVYITGFFELAGAIAILFRKTRRLAGMGLICLIIAVTPANLYMWMHPELFPRIPPSLLTARLFLQLALIFAIGWASRPVASQNLEVLYRDGPSAPGQ